MKIHCESELMKNQKHAVVMAADKDFAALQSNDGDSLFFSIGDKGDFYLTREVSRVAAGWDKVDLSKPLKDQHGGTGLVSTFAVSQNAQTGNIDLALALTVGDSSFLYFSAGHSNSDFDWAKGVQWNLVAFDGPEGQMPATIANVYLMQVQGQGGGTSGEYFVVDLKKASDPLGFYSRYYITPDAAQKWNRHPIASDMAVVRTCLGRSASGLVRPGIYTLGRNNDAAELLYSALHGFRDQAPTVSVLQVPASASAIATALNAEENTNLFVAADGALYLFTPDNLTGRPTGSAVVRNSILSGVTCLYAESNAGVTAVWGVNDAGDLFRLQCQAGSEATPAAWSYPVAILRNVQNISSFLNRALSKSVIFAHLQDGTLIQLTQDPVSVQWQQRNILLPPTGVNDMVEYDSFTTHLRVTDDNEVGVPNAEVSITATTRVGVYLNDDYYILSPSPVTVHTDATGVVTLVQQTQTLSAVVYDVTAKANGATASDSIDPMRNAMGKINQVDGGSYLENLKVQNADGTEHHLLPTGMKDRKNTACVTASSLQQFSTAAKTLPPNSTGGKDKAARAALIAALPETARTWGVSYSGDTCTYHEGAAAVARFGANFSSPAAAADPSLWAAEENAFVLFWEDAWNWFMSILHEVKEWFVHVAEDVWHFFVKIGETIYRVVVDCVSAVVRAVQFVFHKIKVFFEDLIKWLGFIFSWQDILRTHSVLKNVLLCYAKYATGNIDALSARVGTFFDGLQAQIDAWANAPTGPSATVGDNQKSSASMPGQNSPGSNWALHHMQNHLARAKSPSRADSAAFEPFRTAATDGDNPLDALTGLVKNAVGEFTTALDKMKTQIIDPISTLTATEVMKRLAGILGDLLVGIAKDLIQGILNLAKSVIGGLVDLLTAPLNIPIISPIYSWITESHDKPNGEQLSFLDLICLVAAIPATIIYKLLEEKAPFADDDLSRSLMNAKDVAAIRTILASAPVSAAVGDTYSTFMRVFTCLCGIWAMIASFAIAIINGLKDSWGSLNLPLTQETYVIAFCFTLPYAYPNIITAIAPGWDTRWPIMNDVVTSVWLTKAGLDNIRSFDTHPLWANYVSPFGECVVNALWAVPAVCGILEMKQQAASDWVGFTANACFDLGGIMQPLVKGPIAKVLGPEAAAAAFIVQEVLTVGYGLLAGTAGIMVAAGK